MMRIRRKRQKGQAIVEYVILIVVVAVAALVLLGVFSERIQQLISGASNAIGGQDKSGEIKTGDEIIKELDSAGNLN